MRHSVMRHNESTLRLSIVFIIYILRLRLIFCVWLHFLHFEFNSLRIPCYPIPQPTPQLDAKTPEPEREEQRVIYVLVCPGVHTSR